MASSVEEVLEAFIGLYTREALSRWRELFLPGFTAAATNADGSVTTWTLEEFYERQRSLFATGKPISEVLLAPTTHSIGSIACVRSGFVWTDGTLKRPGQLVMLLIAERGRFRIQSLAFSYHG
jgi:SnoaL-like protein